MPVDRSVPPEDAAVEDDAVKTPASTSPDVPLFQVKTLPSGGKGYPEGVTISCRPYTYAEMLYFSESELTDFQRMERILEGIVVEGMPLGDLSYMDYQYVAILRKYHTETETPAWDVPTKCPACGHQWRHRFDVTTLGIKSLDIDLPYTLTLNDLEIEFSPITVADYLRLPGLQKTYAQTEHALLAAALMIKGMSVEDAHQFLATLWRQTDLDNLQRIDIDFDMGVVDFDVICPCVLQKAVEAVEIEEGDLKKSVEASEAIHCGHEYSFSLVQGALLMRPFRDNGESGDAGIRAKPVSQSESGGPKED